MARVTGPLFSLSASGVFRNALEFRTEGGRTVVAGRRKPTQNRSAAQLQQSERFGAAVQGWKDLDLAGKSAWGLSAANTGLNGYQLYLSEYCTQGITPPGQPVIP